MSVRAKFYVAAVELSQSTPEGHTGSVRLQAVTRGEENKSWSHYTPSGEIKMAILNPAALEVFKAALGREFYVDFTPAGPEDPPA